MEWGIQVDLPLVCGKLWCPNFVQVLDHSAFKGVDRRLSALSVKVNIYPFFLKLKN